MSVHLQREIGLLKKALLSQCALVEEQVHLAIRAVKDRDAAAAEELEARDREVDQAEVELEESCLKALALYQPVATDLRFIVTVLKVNNDLERLGDLAVNLAHKATTFASLPPLALLPAIEEMAEKAQRMVKDSIDALIRIDAGLAGEIRSRDDEIDLLKRDVGRRLLERMKVEPERIKALLTMLAVSRNLERIADHAVNVADDVVYMATGHIRRHNFSPAEQADTWSAVRS